MHGTSERVSLAVGRLAVELVPGIGGSISAMRIDGIDVLRPLSEADFRSGDVLGVASFPMIPFANRIGDNVFRFDGRAYRFAMNNPPELYHVHGTSWRRPWTMVAADARGATLTLEVTDPETYSYRAVQRFMLEESGLCLLTTVSNTGGVRMPFGFGHHPWFAREPDTTIQFHATSFHLNEPEGMIGQRIALPPELSFDSPRLLPAYWRCSDYGGWDGSATVTFPARGVGLTLQGDPVYRHVMFYADPSRDVFCVEPQTNASGAFNRPGGALDPEDNLVVLEPGQGLEGLLRFKPFRL